MVLHLFSTDLKIVSFIGSEVSLVDPNFLDAYLLPSSLAKGFRSTTPPTNVWRAEWKQTFD